MNGSFPVKIKIVPFKEWMNAILTVTKTDTLFKGPMVAIRVMK